MRKTGTILKMKWEKMHLSQKWTVCNSQFHFIILPFLSFLQSDITHSLTIFTRHTLLHSHPEIKYSPCNDGQLVSKDPHGFLCIYSVNNKRDNVEYQWSIGLLTILFYFLFVPKIFAFVNA